MDQNQVPYINWEISNKNENTAALKATCGPSGVGNPGCLTASGKLVYDKMRASNKGVKNFVMNLDSKIDTDPSIFF
jgi:hypothetical protein